MDQRHSSGGKNIFGTNGAPYKPKMPFVPLFNPSVLYERRGAVGFCTCSVEQAHSGGHLQAGGSDNICVGLQKFLSLLRPPVFGGVNTPCNHAAAVNVVSRPLVCVRLPEAVGLLQTGVRSFVCFQGC